jgi:hypothetical protein
MTPLLLWCEFEILLGLEYQGLPLVSLFLFRMRSRFRGGPMTD